MSEEITIQSRLRQRVAERDGTKYEARTGRDGSEWGYDAELDSRAADRIDELEEQLDARQKIIDQALKVIKQKNKKLDELRSVLETAHTLTHAAPELNPSNYTHEQACQLNTTMCEVFEVLDSARKTEGGAA